MTTPAERLALIRSRIESAARAAGRAPDSVRLIAVSKTFPAEAVLPLLEAGQRHFGENRVQEAKGKWPALKARFPDLVLHLIGPLQSNKAREAVALFDVIHTVDRPKIAGALAAEMTRLGRRLPVYVEVNVGEEPQKAGIPPGEAAAFVADARARHGLDVVGLMCIPPFDRPPAPYFEKLRELAKAAQVERLSMGMSADFEAAIAAGATDVRVGTALFGTR